MHKFFKNHYFFHSKGLKLYYFHTPWLFFFNRLVKKYHWWSKSDLVSAAKFSNCRKILTFVMTKNTDTWLIIQWFANFLQANFCWNLEGTMPLLVSNGFSLNSVKAYLLKIMYGFVQSKNLYLFNNDKYIFHLSTDCFSEWRCWFGHGCAGRSVRLCWYRRTEVYHH